MRFLVAYIRRLYKGFKGEILSLPSRFMVFSFCLFLFLMPLVITDPYILRMMIMMFIFAIYAASWDLLSGYTGQVSFGHALFLGVSAYTAGLLYLNFGLSPWATIPIGALVAVLAGLIVGVPCLRLRGPYLAIATMAFPIILIGMIFVFPEITGGELGTAKFGFIAPLSPSRVNVYFYTLFLMIASVFLIWKITDSKYGIIFHAIREDEVAARASGIDTTRYKLLTFCVSGFFAGVAGGLYAHTMGVVGPSVLALLISFQAVIWTGFGGIASIYGAVGGVFILYPLTEFLGGVPGIPPALPMLAYAVILIIVLLFMTEGIFHWIRDKIEKECPRCKRRNSATRKTCRVCGAELG